MFETFRNAWKIEDLRKKLLYTLWSSSFSVSAVIPVPFIAPERRCRAGWLTGSGMLGYIDMLTGGSFSRATLFALRRLRRISHASIIIQLHGRHPGAWACPKRERMAARS